MLRRIPGWVGVAIMLVASIAEADPGERFRGICPGADRSLRHVVRDTDFLLLGEIHGSQEVPRFALEATCAALARERPVVLGLEIFSGEQKRIDTFLRSAGTAEDRAALLAGPFWQRTNQDGRASVAMFDLLDAARRLTIAGAALRILCFDAADRQGDRNRDYAMARTLFAEREKDEDEVFVVLTGNIHARTKAGLPWNPDLKPMGWYLGSQGVDLISLNARHTPGEFWVCNPGCGIQKLGGKGDAKARGVERFAERDDAGYHGVFDIGTPSASPPAAGPDAPAAARD